MHTNETGIFFALLIGVCIFLLLTGFFIINIVRYQKKKVALYQERISIEINSLEKDRARIASDLHDEFGALLSAIKMRLQCIEVTDPKEIKSIPGCEMIIDDAMQKLRQISFNLMPQLLQRKGLPDALRELINMLTFSSSIKVIFKCDYNTSDNEKRIHIYRIVQEVLNNSVRHSNATVIELNITKENNTVYLDIKDNGDGFDKEKVLKKNERQGIRNIMSRVELLKAKIFLDTQSGKGVNYSLEIIDE